MFPQRLCDSANGFHAFARSVQHFRKVVALAEHGEYLAQFHGIDSEVFFQACRRLKNVNWIAGYFREDGANLLAEVFRLMPRSLTHRCGCRDRLSNGSGRSNWSGQGSECGRLFGNIVRQAFRNPSDCLQLLPRQIHHGRKTVLLTENCKHFAEFDRIDTKVFLKAGVRFEDIYRVARHLTEDVANLVQEIFA